MRAIEYGNVKIVEKLLELGADIEWKTADGESANTLIKNQLEYSNGDKSYEKIHKLLDNRRT